MKDLLRLLLSEDWDPSSPIARFSHAGMVIAMLGLSLTVLVAVILGLF